jgi:ankyrin repeat protein
MSADAQMLRLLCKVGDLRAVRSLLSQEAPEGRLQLLGTSSTTGWTPLLVAAASGRDAVVEYLLEQRADVNEAHVQDGWTALHLACQQQRGNTTGGVSGGSVGVASGGGGGVVAGGVASVRGRGGGGGGGGGGSGGRSQMVRLLLRARANHAARNAAGETPLHTAAHSDNAYAAVALLEAGADANAPSVSGCSAPLHLAARMFSAQLLVRQLLAHGAAVDVRDSHLATPLFAALEARCVHSVRLLLDHGASLRVCDKAGLTPLQCVEAAGRDLAAFQLILREAAAQRQAQQHLAKLLVSRVRPSKARDVPVFLWRLLFGGPSREERRSAKAFLPLTATWLLCDPGRAGRVAKAVEDELATMVQRLRNMVGLRVAVQWADGRW